MKAKIITGLSVLVFSTAMMFIGMTAQAVEKERPVKNVSESTAIYDRFGQVIESSISSAQPIGTTPPTSLKWLRFGESYQSNGFSGSGTRYGGYIFGLSDSNKAKLTFKLGGFGCFITDRPDPGAIVGYYNLPLSGSPYTLETTGYFYFAVDNPVNGQTYNVRPQ
ncbi:hypothetical protein IGI37_001410 [Enterococcus sp. AZ194]|uniref:hypothetical protein n=1 Tax=Enterococcus sp. AZ194 TaxID=2774629 RepID=UPI003F234A49